MGLNQGNAPRRPPRPDGRMTSSPTIFKSSNTQSWSAALYVKEIKSLQVHEHSHLPQPCEEDRRRRWRPRSSARRGPSYHPPNSTALAERLDTGATWAPNTSSIFCPHRYPSGDHPDAIDWVIQNEISSDSDWTEELAALWRNPQRSQRRNPPPVPHTALSRSYSGKCSGLSSPNSERRAWTHGRGHALRLCFQQASEG